MATNCLSMKVMLEIIVIIIPMVIMLTMCDLRLETYLFVEYQTALLH